MTFLRLLIIPLGLLILAITGDWPILPPTQAQVRIPGPGGALPAGGGGPTQLASDNFDRANENPIASPWVSSGQVSMQIVTNVAVSVNAAQDGAAYYTLSWPNNQYSQATINTTATAGGGTGCGLSFRQTNSSNGYRVVIDDAGSNNVELGKFVSGSFSSIWVRTSAFTTGDTFRAEISGTTIKVFVAGVQVGADTTDSSLSSGNVGIAYSSNETCSIDNWSGGSL